jgi:two-component system chemotaxis response regulator CheB
MRERRDVTPPRQVRPAPSVAKGANPSSRTARQRLRRIGQRLPHPSYDAGVEALDNLVVIGGSAGALTAMASVLESLPLDFPAPIVLIIHQRSDSPFEMALSIEHKTHLPIVVVAKQVVLRRGVIYLPPVGKALSFRRGDVFASVEAVPPGEFTTIDRTFVSAAGTHGDRVIGVVLTGLRHDGTAGLQAVHDAGGLTIVQDPKGAEFPAMPRSAMRDLPVTFCLALPEIGFVLDLLVRRSSRLESGIAVSLRLLKKRIGLLVRMTEQCGRNTEAADFLREELVTLNRDLRSITGLLSTVPPELRS